MGGLTKGYLIRRVGMFFLTVWLGTTIIFIIPRLAPGDPVSAMVTRLQSQAGSVEGSAEMIEAWRARFGLDDPMYIQYLRYMWNSVRFDLGYSLRFFPTTVTELIMRDLPWSLRLLVVAVFIQVLGGNAIGALMGWRRTPRLVRTLLPTALTFSAVPGFMMALLLIFVFAFGLDWFPVSQGIGRGMGLEWQWNWEYIKSAIHHAILPVLAIFVTGMGGWALGMRGMMITTDGEDYMILAQAKGLRPGRVFLRYGVRNAILPQITAAAFTMGGIVSGQMLVEFMFAYPGMGTLLNVGIMNGDYSLIQGVAFYLIVATSFAVLILDLAYPLLDPRITYQKS
ncbi:MAG: ABC transporter permease [Anaerolineae bacterium]|nr:ABC transporter permease [Anaerolineae bacterium]